MQSKFHDFVASEDAPGGLARHILSLDLALAGARADHSIASATADASVPLHGRFQAVAAARVFRGGQQVWSACTPGGRVTAPEVELFAAPLAPCKASALPGGQRIDL